MHLRVSLVAAASLAAAILAQPAAAATMVSGSVVQRAKSIVGSGAAPVVVQAMDSWTRAPGDPEGPADLAANAVATAVGGSDRAVSIAKLAAHWDSADSGVVTVVDHGFEAVTPDAGIGFLSADLQPPLFQWDWSYTFVATEDSVFGLDFDLLQTGDASGLGRWDIAVFQDGGGPQSSILVGGLVPDQPAMGGFRQDLLAGHMYKVALRNGEAFGAAGQISPDGFWGHERGTFTWAITHDDPAAVPEPATWVMMVAGFGLAGAACRRRRRALRV